MSSRDARAAAAPSDREPIDLSNCAREPIHIPGSIQPHGLLFAFAGAEQRLVSVSVNAEPIFGRGAHELLAATPSELFGAAAKHRLAALFDGASDATEIDRGGRTWTATAHHHQGLAFLELEPAPQTSAAPLPLVGAATRRLQAAQGMEPACRAAAEEIRRLTGFDRVLIYRFAADWAGEVVAEDRSEALASYLGHWFPASDIPAQARALYAQNPVRVIPDVGYEPALITPDRHPETGHPIDLARAALRSVSPIHLEYLRNMDVGASMSVSIVKSGHLWGLIACHHATPRLVPPGTRHACELVAQILAWQLGTAETVETIGRSGEVKTLRSRLLAEDPEEEWPKALEREEAALLRLVEASGMAVVAPETTLLLGETPREEGVRAIARFLVRNGQKEPWATQSLSAAFSDAGAFRERASGLMAVPLSTAPWSFLIWFRPELVQTVRWGGDPRKPVEPGADARLHPRKSFETWTEEVRGRSAPWTPVHTATAIELRDVVLDLVVRRQQELERRNRQLARANEALESFVQVASHDLREPLRQVEQLVGFLDEEQPAEFDKINAHIRSATARMRQLIEDLGEFSKGGRGGELIRVPLRHVAEEALAQLRVAIEESGASISLGALPGAKCDPAQIRQVIANLVGNAIKYRQPGRHPSVLIEADEADELASGSGPPFLKIRVVDNGLGFDEEQAERLFEPFVRLHSGPQGSGIGLAICRRIVERHGGTIGATSRRGEGSVFWFTLPAA